MPTKASQPDRSLHQSVLNWRNGRYGKIAVILSLVAIILYCVDDPGEPASGGTWLGYTYGTIGALTILWLGWFGIRRRRYSNKGALLEEWLSAHVYFGLALIIFATLHTGFRFNWNVHGFTFALMVLVIISGIFGIYTFLRYPVIMTRNRGGTTLGHMAEQLVTMDIQCRNLCLELDDDILELVVAALDDYGGPITWGETLFGSRPGARSGRTGVAIERLLASVVGPEAVKPSDVRALMNVLASRWALTEKIRRDRRYQALMLLWRAVHVPLTVALIVALSVHVFIGFYYW